MALDPKFIGRTYPPTAPYEVGREKIREFADAIGDDNPVFREPEAAAKYGHPDVIAPVTFPIVISLGAAEQIVKDPELGLDYSRVVHADQRFSYTRPVRAGDRLVAVVTVENIKTMAGNDIITTRADITTVEGEHVVTARSTLAARGTADEEN
ncbi:MaoC family dehydratase N-terminal domain-containing protein [Yinghuangia sp. ASG 101]|uniref:MaoC family dehydratase N-terminal domain-containing protein n=1 Tax=Yinghuangia sp. ASG 101 TaxID=2896848 RepID=UPI001E598DCE|nr:MaoC family dehydratase N-terminal domain-containing protein [Yinghuangia sp. ASG 101]UGQ14642.1 MaoC family dehydratase N-terminal domain-containing protein [Yinghuangia sp. ASG 101]